MHRSLAIAFLGVAFIIGGMVTATAGNGSGSFKIGYVDFDKILTQTAAGKRANKEFEKVLKAKQAKLDKEQKALQNYAAQLEKQRSILKPEVLKQKSQELQKRYVALQQTYATLERELAEKRTKLIREILKKAEPVIKSIAKQQGYQMIVDRSVVVWSDKGFDLTDRIKSRLN